MKKILLTMFVFGISLFISSMAIAAVTHGDIEDCDALDGEAYELCESYCFAKACATDDPAGNPKSCARLKDNYMGVTGTDVLPCDIITCLACGSADPCSERGALGVCDERKLVDCPDPLMNLGVGIDCADVSIPVLIPIPNNFQGGGCDNMPGEIPDCQNGPPLWACDSFLGGTSIPWPNQCPTPPTCLTACDADSDCLDGYICVEGTCAADVICEEE
jgi:hypothetical protein